MDEKIKVTDKRMFDSRGELREEQREDSDERREQGASGGVETGTHQPDSRDSSATPSADQRSAEARGPERMPTPELVDLIGLLAQPVAMFLGDARLPDGGSAENLALARYHIDLLELLESKTRGNLSLEEEKLLADLLYKLRLRYVEKAGSRGE